MAVPEAVAQRCSVKKVFLEISQNAQVLFCEFCEIFKNSIFTEHLWTTVPIAYLFWNISQITQENTCDGVLFFK